MSDYFMSSKGEAERLYAQEEAAPSHQRLLIAGLREGQTALDAGCGPGAVTQSMLEIVGPRGRVTGFDGNAGLLEEAQRRLAGRDNLELRHASLPQTGLPSEGFDFVWSQYVFEYFKEPQEALAELVRLTRPGGRVVVTDVDSHGFLNWPFPESLKAQADRLALALAERGLDLNVGRKLFTLFRRQGLLDVNVRVFPFYVVAGAADLTLLNDWKMRFEVLRPIGVPGLGGAAQYESFVRNYLELLADPDSLKYALVLMTWGKRP